MSDHAALIEFYRSYGESSFAADEPAYAAVCRQLGDYPDLVGLIAAHPRDAQQPNLLFAAVHYLLLGGLDHRLAKVYDGSSDMNPAPMFADLVLGQRDQINELLATKRTQTNEVGRSAVLALMLADAQARAAGPLAWIDLGASGGLNLNIDKFRIDYTVAGDLRSTGVENTALRLACQVRSGEPPINTSHADIAWRRGIDRAPVDVTDAAQARWLQACLWPSKLERHARLAAAIKVAEEHAPPLIEAEAAAGITQMLLQAPTDATLAITTTWVWYYLPDSTKTQVIELMRTAGRRVLWYSLEGRGVVDELGQPPEREVIDSLIGRVEFDGGAMTSAAVLGLSHPHGTWLDWY